MELKSLESITLAELKPAKVRKDLKKVSKYLKNFECCIENYDPAFPFSILHYAFMFRRFDAVAMIKKSLPENEWNEALLINGPKEHEWITPLVCAKWNISYLYGYDEHIANDLEEMLDKINHIDHVAEYTDIVDENNNKNIFDIFWGDRQPLLDIIYYKKQELASIQVEKNSASLVMDEVGTGKTVSAIYAIRNTIENCKKLKRRSRILIVCPNNKREDWQNDIRRQLGRYAHIVEQSDNGDMYSDDLKKVFFRSGEEIIMISGQKGGNDGKGSHTELKNSIKRYSEDNNWDLVVIDEGHISFNNYEDISAERAMIMTATPIVVNASGKRDFTDYLLLLSKITGKLILSHDIDPVKHYCPDENDVYVNWFKEDMGINSAERNIQFISCRRSEERDELYYHIVGDKGVLTALQYDQDDDYLFSKYNEMYSDDKRHLEHNYKLDKLIELLRESHKSYIIFCEHTDVVDLIYSRLTGGYIFEDLVIAKKYGKIEDNKGIENIANGQLINALIQELRNNRRVLFVTTGKTGGTGLNLGYFDGVIHYELPFTSIELEQRFGRVDRIDTKHDFKKRDMIFMLNECRPDENDAERNRMLYYCVNKIDITCKYMPIRNTVLYYPEFIKRNRDALRKSLSAQKVNPVLSENNERKIKSFKKQRRAYEKQIKDNPMYKIISSDEKESVHKCVTRVLNTEINSNLDEAYYSLLKKYINNREKHKEDINRYDREIGSFRELRRQVNSWLEIVGLCEFDNEDEIMIGLEQSDDFDNQVISLEKADNVLSPDEQEHTDEKNIQKQICSLLEMLDSEDFNDLELKGFSSDGIFCYIDKHIYRSTVDRYRKGQGWF